METSAPGQTLVDRLPQKIGSPVEPALALHEVKKEDPGELQQGQAMPLIHPELAGEAFREAARQLPERVKESLARIFPT